MHIIRLPKDLPGGLDLVALNQRLRTGDVGLDWSEVEPDVQPAVLLTLLAGLNLTEHLDQLGAETVTDALAPELMALLAAAPLDMPEEQAAPTIAASAPTPGLWIPAEATAREDGKEAAACADGKEATVQLSTKESTQPLLHAPSPAAMRDELEDLVLRDLLGPAGGAEEEVSDSRLRERYLVGLLAPDESQVPPEEQESSGTAEEGTEEQGPIDTDSSQTISLSPSTLGLSFCVSLQASELQLTARWGHYQRTDSAETSGASGKTSKVWKRTPRGSQSQPLSLSEGSIDKWYPEPDEQPEVFVRGIIRRRSDCWMVTLFLVNMQKKPKQLREHAYLFQPELSVSAPDGSPIFQRRSLANERIHKNEDRAMAMLYRHEVSFAVGHGVSVHAETLAGDSTSAVRLTTTFVPRYDVPRTEAPTSVEVPALADLCLDMRELAETDVSELVPKILPLVNAYATWIDEQEQKLSDPASRLAGYGDVANTAIKRCRIALARITAGIEMLDSNPQAARAFTFLNRAMWLQRIHTLYAEEQRRGGPRTLTDVDQPVNRSWRPFQLAFILLNLPALTDLHHPERSTAPEAIADLLWFPTGGGKTEAYLGLTAYTLGIRRLQGTIEGRSGENGVAVLMRYTLRLLTLQQFQRAASLICACEIIRRTDSSTWGATPFRLGLWVGQHSTPNTTEASEHAITQDHGIRGGFGGSGSPRQLTNCPWCGTSIDSGAHLKVDRERGRTLMYCGDAFGQCAFSQRQAPGEGLPVLVVDEEIYRLLPALLIATVDKFAQMPWKGETQMLFGQVDQYCPRHGFRTPEIDDKDSHRAMKSLPAVTSIVHAPLRPPDLIIQDELHLISGPLGTLVGLYETIVDTLATWNVGGREVRPKVIAATATIRQAAQQIKSLFMREVEIFPPQGINVADNFFSRQRPPDMETPGRRYLGICAHGKRLKAAQIRVYVAYLAAAQVLYQKYGAAADPWMTLVGYFNSMNGLGGMRRLVDDEIKTRVWRMEQRGLGQRGSMSVEELTSRKSSSDIPEVLARLELGFDPRNDPKKNKPIDVLLATNMISVGVDVKRLGLMVVTSQPKTTAEYIQATSRVGRSFPGLVCIIYNWARPRDLSHYEQFEHYHATFYKHVEALSVTPFSSRALDRGLAALLTSLVRLSESTLNKNDSAGLVTQNAAVFTNAIDAITHRAEEVSNDAEVVERVRADLEGLKTYWLQTAVRLKSLGYKDQKNGITLGLLKDPQRGKWEPFTCLNSLRDVEPTVHLILDENGLDGFDMEASADA